MANILISGLINTETTVRVRQFPVNYYPIDYPFFGVNTAVSGVAYNISKALKTLGDDVTLLTMTGRDFPAEYIQSQLCTAGIGTDWVKPRLKETPNSVVLYDGEGKRQIYCDLKDIQETPYDFPEDICRDADVVAACNINLIARCCIRRRHWAKPWPQMSMCFRTSTTNSTGNSCPARIFCSSATREFVETTGIFCGRWGTLTETVLSF